MSAAAYSALHLAAAAVRASHGRAEPVVLVVSTLATALLAYLALRRRAGDADDEAAPPRDSAKVRAALVMVAIGFAAVACLNLDRYPGLREDETFFLQFPANYARYGRFETRVGEDLGPDLLLVVGTGPTLLTPAAAILAAIGPSLGAARAVSAAYLLFTGFALYLVARRMGGTLAGVVALVSLIGLAETTNTGRMFMGDFAAAGFLLMGGFLWLGSLEPDARRPRLLLSSAGLSLGLMVLTKNSFALTAFGFLAFVLHDRAGERRVRLRHLVVPTLMVIAVNAPWDIYRHARGSRSMAEYAASDLGLVVTAPSTHQAMSKAAEMLGRPEALLAVAALAWGVLGPLRTRHMTVLFGSIGLVWSLWFLTFRIPNYRYLIVPSLMWLGLTAPLVAEALRVSRRRLDPLARSAVLALVVAGLALPALRAVRQLITVVAAKPIQLDEQRTARAIAERLGDGEPLAASQLMFGVLFFGDRPIRVIHEADAASLPAGSLYLWRPREGAVAVGLPGFALEFAAGPYAILRREL